MTVLEGSWGLALTIIAAAVVSDAWRVAGALVASRIDEASLAYGYVKAVATALIAAIIAQLTLYPTGPMSEVPVVLRLGAMALGFAAYLATRRSMVAGTIVCEAVLIVGVAWLG
jgi:hypothetical protein